MKKLLTIAVVAMIASASQAANINWSIAGKASSVAYGVTAASADATSASDSSTALQSTVYLILASDLSSLSGNTSESGFTTALSDLTMNRTYSTSDGKKPSVSELPVKSDLIADSGNTVFGMLTYATDSFGNGWYKIVTDVKSGYADTAGPDAQTLLSLSWADMKNASWTKAWEKPIDPDPGPTPGVPEPATGALALAGVALLFKRRRA